MIRILLLMIAFGLSQSVLAQSSPMVVITHPEVSQQSVTQRQLRRIFMLKQRSWNDGSPISLIVLSSDNLEHAQFLREQLKMFPYQLEREWNKLIYSGQSAPPIVATDSENMLSLVASTPGAIGYLVNATANDNVTVLKVTRP